MVNKKKLETKLPSLLIDGETTNPTEWNEYQKKRQRLITYKKNHPQEFQSLTQRVIQILEEIDAALYNDLVVMDMNLTKDVRDAFRKKKP